MDKVTFENTTIDPDGPGEEDDFDLPDPTMKPPLDVQQLLNSSGDNLQSLQEELREAELEAQKKRLVDSFYNEVSHTYGLCPEGRIDYSHFGIDPNGKTLNWTPEDKKISIAATTGKFRCPEDTGRVAHMHCGDRWGSLIIDRGHRGGSAERSWRHSREQRRPSRKTLRQSS